MQTDAAVGICIRRLKIGEITAVVDTGVGQGLASMLRIANTMNRNRGRGSSRVSHCPNLIGPPPRVTDFDKRGGLSTDRAMIRACPATWPWNLLGWPSINVPAGFTYGGLPIGVQLMGPANSEPLLISLAAELEALNGWAMRQPDVWWDRAERPPHVGGQQVERLFSLRGEAVDGQRRLLRGSIAGSSG